MYNNLHGCVQGRLHKRNLKRQKANLLGMQFLEPKWLPNAINPRVSGVAQTRSALPL